MSTLGICDSRASTPALPFPDRAGKVSLGAKPEAADRQHELPLSAVSGRSDESESDRWVRPEADLRVRLMRPQCPCTGG